MTQDDRWLEKYNEVKSFIEIHHRNPSRYDTEERGKYCNWLRHNKKLFRAGELQEPRLSLFVQLLALSERYKHINQWK